MVSRITPEGSKLFSADILVENDGALTADMAASATVTVNGETVYPYEAGKLAYYRTGDLVSTVDGTVISSNLVDYLQVTPGQVLVRIDGEESESQMFTIQQNLDTAREELQTAEKNLANCKAVAPIDGMVIGLTIQPGDEIPANTTVVTVSDTSTVVISANVDERNISYIKPGMSVELDQWGTPAFGTVEMVSLSSTVNNGVATYPITISADNAEGTLQVNSYVNYTITASENDNCLVLPLQCVRTVSQEDGTTVNVVFVEGSPRAGGASDRPPPGGGGPPGPGGGAALDAPLPRGRGEGAGAGLHRPESPRGEASRRRGLPGDEHRLPLLFGKLHAHGHAPHLKARHAGWLGHRPPPERHCAGGHPHQGRGGLLRRL